MKFALDNGWGLGKCLLIIISEDFSSWVSFGLSDLSGSVSTIGGKSGVESSWSCLSMLEAIAFPSSFYIFSRNIFNYFLPKL